tara:strand:- start:202 stop:438 length:237 start_codon:yes stop_codon:yes gene_type:complete
MNIKHRIWNHKDTLYIIHRAIPENQMHPQHYNINSDNVNGMIKVWAEWLRDQNKTISKVFHKDGAFLFCEKIEEAKIL